MKDTLVDSSTVDEFASAFPSQIAQTVNGLKAELPSYKAAVDDVDHSFDAHDGKDMSRSYLTGVQLSS